MEGTNRRLIDIRGNLKSPVRKKLYSLVEPSLERLLAIAALNKSYDEFSSSFDSNGNFFESVLDMLGVRFELSDEDRAKIPETGSLVVVANHPYGGLDGIVLGAILTSVRQDVKILANGLLCRIRELEPWLLSVNPFDTAESVRNNIKGLKQAMRWLRQGGAMATFPSGTVSHLQLRKGGVADPDWSKHTVSLIRRSKATTLPIFFDGRNSVLFQIMGLLSPWLRTALLPRELMNKGDRTVKVKVGTPIPFAKLERYASDQDAVNSLRVRTYIQRKRSAISSLTRKGADKLLSRFFEFSSGTDRESVVAEVAADRLQGDIDRLPEDCCLTRQREFSVYAAPAERLPHILDEIGRLREKTFREVGEGTGRERDLDRFDEHYLHLFVWNEKKREIVGAYRLGLTDRLLDRFGIDGLYTSTLFQFKPGFFHQINPAIEMGRSFIRSEYQKKRQSLALLWKGIGAFVARHPRYSVLFGPVSISGDYNPLSRNLMVQFFKANKFNKEIARLVRAKNPPKRKVKQRFKERLAGIDKKILQSALRSTDDVSALISEIEEDAKGIPILLRHYLKLNGILLSFNVDKDFSRVLDGLILVDLGKTEPRVLKHYMGKEGCKAFRDYVERTSADH